MTKPVKPLARPASARGYSEEILRRLPPGQVLTRKWPVLHEGGIPAFDPGAWRLEITGAVARPASLTWEAFNALPKVDVTADFHCVTRWSMLGSLWGGVAVGPLVAAAGPLPEAAFALVHCAGGYTTNLPLADLLAPQVLLMTHHEGVPLAPEHGYPVRLVVPHLYGWKSAKWVLRLEIRRADQPGYWEARGYHRRGDPWREERFDD